MCVPTSSLLRRFSTHISLHPTLQVWKKVSSKERLLDFSEETLQVTTSWERLPREANLNDSLRSEIWREEISPPTKTKREQTNLSCLLSQYINHQCKPKTNSHEKMAFNKTTTITERNLQESAPYFIQKRAFAQRYTRESLTMQKLKTLTRESCRPVNPILHLKPRSLNRGGADKKWNGPFVALHLGRCIRTNR